MSSFPCKLANEKLVQEPIKTGSEWAQMLSFAGKSFKVAIIYMFKELKKNFFFKLKKKKKVRDSTNRSYIKKVQK